MSRSPHSIKMKTYTQIILLFQEDSLSKYDVRQKPLEHWCWVGMCQKADIQISTLGEDFSPNFFSSLWFRRLSPQNNRSFSKEPFYALLLCSPTWPSTSSRKYFSCSDQNIPFPVSLGNAAPKAHWGCFCPSNTRTVLILDWSCY